MRIAHQPLRTGPAKGTPLCHCRRTAPCGGNRGVALHSAWAVPPGAKTGGRHVPARPQVAQARARRGSGVGATLHTEPRSGVPPFRLSGLAMRPRARRTHRPAHALPAAAPARLARRCPPDASSGIPHMLRRVCVALFLRVRRYTHMSDRLSPPSGRCTTRRILPLASGASFPSPPSPTPSLSP